MKKILCFVIISFVFFSCAPVDKEDLPNDLTENQIPMSAPDASTTQNVDNSSKTSENYETNAFFNEIADKLPELYDNLLQKLKTLDYKVVVLKKQPHFGFSIQSNSMEWIVKSLIKRRKYLLDRIELMITVQFVKYFKSAGINVILLDSDDQESAEESLKNCGQIADAYLVVNGSLKVSPLEALSVTGREYLLRLVYEVQANLVDLKRASRTWYGSTTWRRNLFVTTFD